MPQSIAASSVPAPFSFTVDPASVAPTDTLVFDISRRSNRWVFVGEVTFDGAAPSAVPLPVSGLSLLRALSRVAAWRRKRR
ncbi:MAG: hypothetical protein AAGL96_01780 [Pseudomonadota bacterium]